MRQTKWNKTTAAEAIGFTNFNAKIHHKSELVSRFKNGNRCRQREYQSGTKTIKFFDKKDKKCFIREFVALPFVASCGPGSIPGPVPCGSSL